MFDLDTLKRHDSLGMYKVYDSWPQIAKKCRDSDLEPVGFENVSHVVLAGMGGSGAIHDIISAILSKVNVHISVVKGYHIPNTVDANTLVVTTSVSGNTAETLTVLGSAKRSGCRIVAFSDGGKMMDYCTKNNIEYRRIPMYHSPRASFISFLFSVLKVLQPVIPIKNEDITESIDGLELLQRSISSENLTEKNPALGLANWITEMPVIYYPWGLQAAAIRFKNSLQENAKMHAIAEDVIEACHNGVVAWEKQSNFKPILLRGQDDYIKTKERWEILKEFFEKKQIDYKEISSVSGSILSKLINLIYLLDFATIYLAAMRGINPTPVDAIDFIKSRTDG